MRNLLFASLFLAFLSCRSVYDGLEPTALSVDCLSNLKPSYHTTWYNAKVDVVGKHLSGLLLIKQSPPNTTRMVFTNEPGVKFFDIEFADDTFKVHYVIRQLNKKPVVQTLKQDFELILMNQADSNLETYRKNNEQYYCLKGNKETTYWVTDEECTALSRVELTDGKKVKVKLEMFGEKSVPDSLYLKHYNFNMQIGLKRLPQ